MGGELKTYLVLSYTNYGETVTVFNAKGEDDLKEMIEKSLYVWDEYDIVELETGVRGEIGNYGGDRG